MQTDSVTTPAVSKKVKIKKKSRYFEIAVVDRLEGVEVFGRVRYLLLCGDPGRAEKSRQVGQAPH